VEFGIDDQSRVIEAVGINDEGRQLLQEIDVLGRDVEEATEELIRQAKPYIDQYAEIGYGEIVIASTIVADMIGLNQEELQEQVKSVVYRVVQADVQAEQADPASGQSGTEEQGNAGTNAAPAQPSESDDASRQNPIKVATLSVPKEVREDAKEKGISAGKLAVGLIIADKTGQEVPISDIESKSITQLVEENGWLDSMLQQDQEAIRENLEQLFQKSVKGKSNIGFEKPASWSQDGGDGSGKGNNGRDEDRGNNSVKGNYSRSGSQGNTDSSKGNTTNNNDRGNNSEVKNSNMSIYTGDNNGDKNGNDRNDDRSLNSNGKGKDADYGKRNNGKGNTDGIQNGSKTGGSDSRSRNDQGKNDAGKSNPSDRNDRTKYNGSTKNNDNDNERDINRNGWTDDSRYDIRYAGRSEA